MYNYFGKDFKNRIEVKSVRNVISFVGIKSKKKKNI